MSLVFLQRSCPQSMVHCKRSTRSGAQLVPRDSQRLSYSRRAVVRQAIETVGDAMTSGVIHACSPDDTIERALEMLVEFRITGLPVVDDKGKIVGVVSDYDLLALDAIGRTTDEELFPTADQSWQAFKEVKTLLAKAAGKRVKDVMTKTPIVVDPDMCINDAARILLSKKIRRLPVVDKAGNLVGVISRGNLVKAALASRKAATPTA